jgi:hypothetical protein
VADEVCRCAGIPSGALAQTQVEIRGHAELMMVRIEKDPTVLASLLAPAPTGAPSEELLES